MAFVLKEEPSERFIPKEIVERFVPKEDSRFVLKGSQPDRVPRQYRTPIPFRVVKEAIVEQARQAIEPLRRIPEIYQQKVEAGSRAIKEGGVLGKIGGALELGFAPLTAPIEALVGEPVEATATQLGATPNQAAWARAFAETAAYFFSPGAQLKKAQLAKQLPSLRAAAKFAIKPTKIKSGVKVMELVRERFINIDRATLQSENFIRKYEVGLSKLEREAIPFIRQKIKDVNVLKKIGREDLIPIVSKPSPALQKATKEIGQYYDEAYEFLKANWDDVGYVEDYVTQLWDIPKNRRSEVINYFATRNPFLKKRTIPTLEEGIKLGLKPKTTDIVDLLRVYDQFKIKTVYNLKFAKKLTDFVDDVGTKLVQRSDKAPIDWITIDHPAMRRAMMVGKVEKGIILSKVPVKVHPDIAREVKVVFDQPFSHAAITALETINAFTKKSMLTLSGFHAFALTEAGFSSGIGRKTIGLWNPYKIYRALKFKDYEIFRRMPLADDAIKHGVKFGALPDVQLQKVRRSLLWVERRLKEIPVAGRAAKTLRQANDLWDRALWDYYHNTLKLYAYESQVLKELKRQKAVTPEHIAAIKNRLGGFVNDSFGGQRWEMNKIMGNPKMQQMLHWLLLAPDWTISTLKQAAAPVVGIAKGQPDLAVRGTLFWLRAVLYYNMAAQGANYYNTKKYTGEGKFTWENDPGHELNIFAGFNEDGTKRYIRLGKQFREVHEWAMNPINKLGSKLSPVLRETIRQIAKHDPGSGFPTSFESQEFWESLPERAKSIAEMPIPFSLRPYIEDRPTMFMFSLPASKGMTNYKTVKLFKKSLEAKDVERIKRIYVSALENNLDAEQLFKSANAAVKADITFDNKKLALEIFKELRGLDPQAQRDALGVYKRKGVLTKEIWEQLGRIFDQQSRIQQQRRELQILQEQAQ